MKPQIETVAFLDLSNYPNKKIAEKLNCPVRTIQNLKRADEYKEYIDKLKNELKEAFLNSYGDLFTKLNQASSDVIDSFIQINKTGEKDADRIKAGIEILDRAPQAPKKITAQDAQAAIIEFSTTVFKNMKAALQDTNNDDIMDLIEHKDFETIKNESEDEEIEILDINDM
jgi:hypothetical protein